MESFIVAINAVLPFLIYIVLGYTLRNIGVCDKDFMAKLNRFVFVALYPCLMFWNIYSNETIEATHQKMIAACVISVLAVIAAGFAVVPRIIPENSKRSVIIQALYRSNIVLFALPLTQNIFGDAATTTAALLLAFLIPLYNVGAVIILEFFRGKKPEAPELIRCVCTNPLLLGTIVGAAFLLLGIKLPTAIEKPVSAFSDMSTPLALFVLGGTLEFKSVIHNLKYHIPTLGIKMIVFPALAILIGTLMGMNGVERFLYFSLFATPVAAASYTMACNMDADGDLAGELVVLSTAVSVVSLFGWIFFMASIGILY